MVPQREMKAWIPFTLLWLGANCLWGQSPVAPPPQAGVAVEPASDSLPPQTQGEPSPPSGGATPTPAVPPPLTPPPATPQPVAAQGNDKAIPQAYSEEHYAATWARNPFLIETTKGPVQQGPGFAEDWELRGLTRTKGQPEALLGNKKTQEFRWVKTTEDKDGFKLVDAKIDRDLHNSSVEVAKSGETATFKFPEVAAAPATGNRPAGLPPMPAPPGGMNNLQKVGGAPGQNPVNRPGTGMPVPGNANNIPRPGPTNPGIRPPGGVQMPQQPTGSSRRRVLIPPSAPTPGT